MTYEKFICRVKEEVQKQMGEEVQVCLHQVKKNNGIQLDGLTIKEKDNKVAPTIYLNDLFLEYEKGDSMEKIVEQVLSLYHENRISVSISTEFYQIFDNVKDNILCKLINYEKNKELLEEVPYVKYLDLAIVFYYKLEHEIMGKGTILVYNSHLTMWKMTDEEIYSLARENTKKQLPFSFGNILSVVDELLEEEGIKEKIEEETEDIEFYSMYVLTNEDKNLGAVQMIFDSVLTQIGDCVQENFYILPSSIHEVIIVPASKAPDKEEMNKMVEEVNKAQVLPHEVLSDHAYFYQWQMHRLSC